MVIHFRITRSALFCLFPTTAGVAFRNVRSYDFLAGSLPMRSHHHGMEPQPFLWSPGPGGLSLPFSSSEGCGPVLAHPASLQGKNGSRWSVLHPPSPGKARGEKTIEERNDKVRSPSEQCPWIRAGPHHSHRALGLDPCTWFNVLNSPS